MPYRPTPFNGATADLPRYLNQELGRISAEFETAQGAGSLFRNEPAPLVQLDTTPTILQWTGRTPIRYDVNVDAEVPEKIWLQQQGIWALSFVVTAALEPQGTYDMATYVGGNRTNLSTTVDPSNQSDVVTFTAIGTQRLDAQGARAIETDVRVVADQANRDFTMLEGYFSAWWCAR